MGIPMVSLERLLDVASEDLGEIARIEELADGREEVAIWELFDTWTLPLHDHRRVAIILSLCNYPQTREFAADTIRRAWARFVELGQDVPPELAALMEGFRRCVDEGRSEGLKDAVKAAMAAHGTWTKQAGTMYRALFDGVQFVNPAEYWSPFFPRRYWPNDATDLHGTCGDWWIEKPAECARQLNTLRRILGAEEEE